MARALAVISTAGWFWGNAAAVVAFGLLLLLALFCLIAEGEGWSFWRKR